MQPNDSRPTSPIIPNRPYLRPESERTRPQNLEVAAGVVRNQIDSIYHDTAKAEAKRAEELEKSAEQADANPYDRTHKPNRTVIHAEQWKKYHSAWQDYYRQYYERYYLGEVYRMKQALAGQPTNTPATQQATAEGVIASKPDTTEVVYDLKRRLLGNIRSSAVKARKSRHFAPLVAAAAVMLVVVGLPLFLIFNQIVVARAQAYISPGNINPANIIVDPTSSIPVGNEPKLIIPKINVDVPVVYDTSPDPSAQLKAMESGVAWFGIPGANSKPGQIGNTVLSGHSSNDLFDPGSFKFIFARLEQLTIDDTFFLHYEGTRYTYKITKREVVKPTDVQKLIYDTDKPVVTLITCVPLGTAQNRLLVTAEQVSPNPSRAEAAPIKEESSQEVATMPGNSPTFFSRLFGND